LSSIKPVQNLARKCRIRTMVPVVPSGEGGRKVWHYPNYGLLSTASCALRFSTQFLLNNTQ
jgi:hypothetical protein